MEVGAEVWVRDPGPETWVGGVVVKKTPAPDAATGDDGSSLHDLEIELETGGGAGGGVAAKSFRVAAGETEMADLKLRNEEDVALVEDLITLPHLHEPALLHSLSQRFAAGAIYTFTGPILLAVNPFKRLPLYTEETLLTYFEQGLLGAQGLKTAGPLPPHVYAIADAAYRAMMESIRSSSSTTSPASPAAASGSQSILISGESGAGKTESTKHVMRYLTTVGAPNNPGSEGSGGGGDAQARKGSGASETVMARVLQSNPVLEAFGNARTIRNDNSSRFGKFIELHFDKRGRLLGASVETYLLEKVRLPHQAPDERSFHIFYQLLAGATDAQRQAWKLGPVESYAFVNQGGCFALRDVDDRDELAATLRAMRVLGFPEATVDSLLRLVAGLLHLGQVSFAAAADDVQEGSRLAPGPAVGAALATAAELLGLAPAYLTEVLTTRVVETRGEAFTVKLRPDQAQDARDALAKALYGRMFLHLVARINACIACADVQDTRASISVLDIFGFECFAHNSFEQLCINYTNEALQQQFNRFVFKMEQAEYEREQIQWSFIAFPDNQDCLDLIEGRPQGILAMLDDECKINGSDAKLTGRLHKELAQHARFYATKKMQAERQFGIRHYAGEVAYDTHGFLEKNKDTLPKEATSLFLSSDSPLVRELFAPTASSPASPARGSSAAANKALRSPPPPGGGDAFLMSPGGTSVLAAASVGGQLKQQLLALMGKIHQTRPHYIRCLKPNDQNVPDALDRARLTEQLRYGGVLEAVRVARSGYPVRLPHPEFYARYRCLATAPAPALALPSSSSASDTTGDGANGKGQGKGKGGPQQGLLGAGAFPYHVEDLGVGPSREWCQRVLDAVLTLQEQEAAAAAEGGSSKWHRTLERASVQLGRTKVFLRKAAYEILEHRRTARMAAAVVRLQAFLRGASLRREFVVLKAASLRLQRVVRGMQARRRVARIRAERAAVRVQTAWRAQHAARRYRRFRGAVLALQSAHRGRHARAQAFALRTEQKALLLQTWVRMALARARYRRFRRSVVALQCGHRRRAAKRLLRELRQEARAIGTLQRSNEKLKEELAELRERLQRKAEQERQEKERELEAARARAAAAAQRELEEWKRKCGELERAYAEEKARRVEAEAQAARAGEEAATQGKKWREEAELAAAAKEEKRRMELEMQHMQHELEQESRKRQQLEEQLRQQQRHHASSLENAAAHAPHTHHRRGSSTGAAAAVGGSHHEPHHRLVEALSQQPTHPAAPVEREGSGGGSGAARARAGSKGGEGEEESEAASPLASLPYATRTASLSATAVPAIPESPPVDPELDETGASAAAAAPGKGGGKEGAPADAAAADASTTTAAGDGSTAAVIPPLPRRPSSAGRAPMRRQSSTAAGGAMHAGSASSLANAALVAAAAAVAAQASAAAERDELDGSVNIADEDQVLAPKGDRLVRRKEEVDRLAARCKAHRAYLAQGMQVEVFEILASSSQQPQPPQQQATDGQGGPAPQQPQPQPQYQQQFVPVKMRLEGLEPTPALGLLASQQALTPEQVANELARARLVWEEEKPKRSLLGSLGWGSSSSAAAAAAAAASGKKPPPPAPVGLAELYAVVRGVRRVRPRAEVLVAAANDQSRLLTLTTQSLPDKPRRGLVLRFSRREERNHFLDALRTCLGELLQLDDPEGQGLQEVAAALERRALMLAHHEGEGRNFVPLPDATQVLAQERRGARQALGLALETAMDVGGLEDENRELCRQIAEQMRVLREKEELLGKAHEEHKERITLLKRLQDLEMDNADLKLIMQKSYMAEAAQHDAELQLRQSQLEAQVQVNQEIMDKMVGVQRDNYELKEQVDRLAELIQQRDQELAMLKGLTFQGPNASPGGSPLSLTGRASVTPSESPAEAAGVAAAAGANNAAAAGAKVLFSLPGQRDG